MADDGGGIRTDVRRGGARPSFDDLYDQTYAAVYNYAYFRLLAACDRALAARAGRVIETVCGIPVFYKGG